MLHTIWEIILVILRIYLFIYVTMAMSTQLFLSVSKAANIDKKFLFFRYRLVIINTIITFDEQDLRPDGIPVTDDEMDSRYVRHQLFIGRFVLYSFK